MKPATTPSVARWLVQATDQTKGPSTGERAPSSEPSHSRTGVVYRHRCHRRWLQGEAGKLPGGIAPLAHTDLCGNMRRHGPIFDAPR